MEERTILHLRKKPRTILHLRKKRTTLHISKIKKLDNMFLVRDNQIYHTDDDITLHKSFKGSNVMIQYKPYKYVAVPYRYYKKLKDIKEFDMEYSIIIDEENDMFDDTYITNDLELDRLRLFTMVFSTTDTLELIKHIIDYEDFWKSIDDYAFKMHDLVYVGREIIEITDEYGDKEKMTYSQFFKIYFNFLAI